MTDFFTKKITVYNDIPATVVSDRRFDRHVVNACLIQKGIVSKADGTVENVVNSTTIFSKNVDTYVPQEEYLQMPEDLAKGYWTVQVGDVVIEHEASDIVETGRDLLQIQQKYADSFSVGSIQPNINGLSVDNVSFSSAG